MFSIIRFVSWLFSKNITEYNASKAQIELLRFMEYLSEEYMCASWMHGFDESLYAALHQKTGCSSFFERDTITKDNFDKLKKFHWAVNGWWRFMDDAPPKREMVFLRLNEWYPAVRGRREPLKYEDLRNNCWSHNEYST